VAAKVTESQELCWRGREPPCGTRRADERALMGTAADSKKKRSCQEATGKKTAQHWRAQLPSDRQQKQKHKNPKHTTGGLLRPWRTWQRPQGIGLRATDDYAPARAVRSTGAGCLETRLDKIVTVGGIEETSTGSGAMTGNRGVSVWVHRCRNAAAPSQHYSRGRSEKINAGQMNTGTSSARTPAQRTPGDQCPC